MHLSTVETVLAYEVRSPAHFCFNVEAARWPSQNILGERLVLPAGVAPHAFTEEHSGNRFLRFDAQPGLLSLHYKAEVEVHPQVPDPGLRELPLSQVPDDVFPYLMATRYCESDVLCNEALRLFGAVPPGHGRVKFIEEWIRSNIRYTPGSTTSTTTAHEVLEQRAGVCRDFAHLGITFCRALNIPARIVVGYVWFDDPPQDFHAVFEAWLGGRWVLFDPTGMAPVDRLVRIGTGRDAKDVAFVTMFGDVRLASKKVMVLEHDPRPRHAVAPTPAPALARMQERVGA